MFLKDSNFLKHHHWSFDHLSLWVFVFVFGSFFFWKKKSAILFVSSLFFVCLVLSDKYVIDSFLWFWFSPTTVDRIVEELSYSGFSFLVYPLFVVYHHMSGVQITISSGTSGVIEMTLQHESKLYIKLLLIFCLNWLVESEINWAMVCELVIAAGVWFCNDQSIVVMVCDLV